MQIGKVRQFQKQHEKCVGCVFVGLLQMGRRWLRIVVQDILFHGKVTTQKGKSASVYSTAQKRIAQCGPEMVVAGGILTQLGDGEIIVAAKNIPIW